MRTDSGRSDSAIDAVRQMSWLDIAIDVSHVSPKNDRRHRRNQEQEALKLLADKEQVVGSISLVYFLPQDPV